VFTNNLTPESKPNNLVTHIPEYLIIKSKAYKLPKVYKKLLYSLLPIKNYLIRSQYRNPIVKKYDYLVTSRPLLSEQLNLNNPNKLKLCLHIYSLLKNSTIAIILGLSITTSLIFLRDLPINKHLFSVGSILLFVYLLLSGFVFFIKKYRYGKYTTAMHRF
jgi:hypothetical protein